jgi:hypothetical protein
MPGSSSTACAGLHPQGRESELTRCVRGVGIAPPSCSSSSSCTTPPRRVSPRRWASNSLPWSPRRPPRQPAFSVLTPHSPRRHVDRTGRSFSTNPQFVDRRRNQPALHRLAIHILCTQSRVSRRNIGACVVSTRSYIRLGLHGGRVGILCLDYAPCDRLGGEFRGGRRRNQGLRRPMIRVATPTRAGEASRAPHPRRRGASACSAKGRSATRSDSQRSHRRTLRPGQAAWGWKPEPPIALPRTQQSRRR